MDDRIVYDESHEFRPSDHTPPRAMDFNEVPVVPFRQGHQASASLAEAVRRWQETDLTPFYEQLQRAMEEVGESFARMRAQWREAGVLPEEPPTDPKARALWLRQHRNTGPARPNGQNAHAPRRHQ